MNIGGFDTGSRTLVIAEIGNNHEGSGENASNLVRLAAKSGANAVKFQTFRTEHYVSRDDAARFARLKSFELPYAQFERLADEARALGMLFLSTPFDVESATFLSGVADCYKVASGDLTFYPLIRRLAQSDKPIILSTGASDLELVRKALTAVEEIRGAATSRSVAVLHCVSAYPAPESDINLKSIPYLAAATGLTVGYSDHTTGTMACLGAVALGARIIEKHFTLDKHFSEFRDHQLSADPAEFSALVEQIRSLESMLGTEGKTARPSEVSIVPVMRRSIVAARDLEAGRVLCESDITWVRPAGGLSPGNESALLGRRLRSAIPMGTRLSLSDMD